MNRNKHLKRAMAISGVVITTLGGLSLTTNNVIHADSIDSSRKITMSSQSKQKLDKESVQKTSSSKVAVSNTQKTSSSKVAVSDTQKTSSSKIATSDVKKAKKQNREKISPEDLSTKMQPSLDVMMDKYNQYKDIEEVNYTAEATKTAHDLIQSYIKNYNEGLISDSDISIIKKQLDNAKEAWEDSASYTTPYIKEKRELYKAEYDAWSNLYNLLTGESTGTSSSDESTGTSSSDKSTGTSSSDESTGASSNDKSTGISSSDKKHPNVTPEQSQGIVNRLQPIIDRIAKDIEQYGDTDNQEILDALIKAAESANYVADIINQYMHGDIDENEARKAMDTFMERINELKTLISNEDNEHIRKIMEHELALYQEAYNILNELLNDEQDNNGVRDNDGTLVSNTSSMHAVQYRTTTSSTIKNVDLPTNVSTVAQNNHTTSAKMLPQTGEKNQSVLVSIGVALIGMVGLIGLLKRKKS